MAAHSLKPSRVGSARRVANAVLGRTPIDGWIIEAVGTPAENPSPGDTITINATATNVDDDEDNALTVDAFVDGARVTGLIFSAAVTGLDTVSFEARVPDKGSFEINVGGETTTIQTSTFEPEPPQLEFIGSPFDVPNSVTRGQQFDVAIEVGCTGVGPASCPDRSLSIEVDGETKARQTISGLAIPESQTVRETITVDRTGTREIVFRLDGRTERTSVNVTEPTEPTEPTDGTAPPTGGLPSGLPSTRTLIAGVGGTLGFLVLALLLL